MARNFTVHGPFKLHPTKMKANRHFEAANAATFWADHPELVSRKGCYIFAMRAAKGSKPVYVGKATTGFGNEAFTGDKRDKLNRALANQKKGTPLVYFACLQTSKGKTNEQAIDNAETFLIQVGRVANPQLLNKQKAKVETWSIAGIIRSPKGPRSTAAGHLRKCLKLDRA
jgi:hypothetical protein